MSIWVCEYCQIRDHKNDEIYTIAPLVPTRCVYCGSDAKYSVAAEKREHKTLWGLPLVEVNLLPALYGEWTTTPPTEPGWYWVRQEMPSDTNWVTVKWQYDKSECVNEEGIRTTHWLGPIPQPEPPTE